MLTLSFTFYLFCHLINFLPGVVVCRSVVRFAYAQMGRHLEMDARCCCTPAVVFASRSRRLRQSVNGAVHSILLVLLLVNKNCFLPHNLVLPPQPAGYQWDRVNLLADWADGGHACLGFHHSCHSPAHLALLKQFHEYFKGFVGPPHERFKVSLRREDRRLAASKQLSCSLRSRVSAFGILRNKYPSSIWAIRLSLSHPRDCCGFCF